MRWDDVQLLQRLDEIEEANSHIGNGQNLLLSFNQKDGLPMSDGQSEFARELILAHDAGLLTWTDRSVQWVGPFNPTADPWNWLQTVDDVKLTIAGRDRARGRLIQLALPDPNEDDGRILTGLTMEEIARSIGETYAAEQIPRYLRESGIPSELLTQNVEGDKWLYVFNVLSALHEGGSASRRTLREFIGGWLEGHYHAPPSAALRARIVTLLAQQGWHVEDGRLVIGQRVYIEPGTVTPLGRDAMLGGLHSDIRPVISRFVEDHLDVAIFEAFKAVNNRIKEMSALNLDGSKLVDGAIGGSSPIIVFADRSTQTGQDIQQGLHFMFKGALLGIRNPDAHEQFQLADENESLEELAFASMLMRKLDSASVEQKS